MRIGILFILLGLIACSVVKPRSNKAVAVILDTDIGPDYDDVGAMAVLHALADRGEAEILAVIPCNKNPLVVPVIRILNTYFGRPGIPTASAIAQSPDKGAPQKWPEMLVEKYGYETALDANTMDAVTTYRKILARQPDASVTVISVGFLTNLAYLLESKPDEFSPLNGTALVKKKVKHLVAMAGAFPSGREYNVYVDSLSAEKACNGWPTPILFSGHEIGRYIKTGLKLIANERLQSPVKEVYAHSIPRAKGDSAGRMSWDQTAVLAGIRGSAPYFKQKKGRMVIKGGRNLWEENADGPHAYLVKEMPFEKVAEIIEALMMHEGKPVQASRPL